VGSAALLACLLHSQLRAQGTRECRGSVLKCEVVLFGRRQPHGTQLGSSAPATPPTMAPMRPHSRRSQCATAYKRWDREGECAAGVGVLKLHAVLKVRGRRTIGTPDVALAPQHLDLGLHIWDLQGDNACRAQQKASATTVLLGVLLKLATLIGLPACLASAAACRLYDQASGSPAAPQASRAPALLGRPATPSRPGTMQPPGEQLAECLDVGAGAHSRSKPCHVALKPLRAERCSVRCPGSSIYSVRG